MSHPTAHGPRRGPRPIRSRAGAPAPLRWGVVAALMAALLGEARAEDPAPDPQTVAAEHARLSDEMETLASRQIWSGVDKTFRKLDRLGTELSEKDYLHGAYAARELGDVLSVYERLKAAARIHGTREIVDWLWDIDNNYGRVELVTVPPRATTLEAATMPFDPNQRKAVEAAIASTSADGLFYGMLPRGDYSFSGQAFHVEAGVAVRIEVSPRVRRQGVVAPKIIYPDRPGTPPPASPPSTETP
jgi:hypothetical protein